MNLSDDIRKFACEKYIDPARKKGKTEITIRAGNIHKEMGLISRMPTVCSALKSKKLEEMGNVKSIIKKAPPSGEGSNLFLTYIILPPVSGTAEGLTGVIHSMSKRWNKMLKPLVPLIVKKFSSFYSKAEKLSGNTEKIQSILEQVLKKLKENNATLNQVFSNIEILVRMVGMYINGRYRKVPVVTIISIIAALLYFLSPVDIIPDFIPVIGYIDDIAVIMFVVNSIKDDLDDFGGWEKGNG